MAQLQALGHPGVASFVASTQLNRSGVEMSVSSVQLNQFGVEMTVSSPQMGHPGIGTDKAEEGSFILLISTDALKI